MQTWENINSAFTAKRLRNAVKGIFGDPSTSSGQYEMAGGTRLSERKTAARKTTNDQSKTPCQ